MTSEKITMYRINDEQTEVIEQLPKTITSQVYDHENEQFLDETVGDITQTLDTHKTNSLEQKHISVVSSIPNDVSNMGIMFKVDGSSPTPPSMTMVDSLNERVSYVDKQLSGWVNVKNFGVVGDGIQDDTRAIQRAIDAISEEYHGDIGGDTFTATSLKLFFPKGTYRITNTINFQRVHKVDFGNAIIKLDTNADIFAFSTLSYNAFYIGGVFVGKKIFNVYNPNQDQGRIVFENAEFKGCDVAIQTEVQSSKCLIEKCKFDNVIHPLIQLACDDMQFINNWCQSNRPTQNSYGNIVVEEGRLTLQRNILIPLNAKNTSVTESAWIDFSGTWLEVSNNRFSGEVGSRCPVNWKKAAVTAAGIIQCGLSMKDNLVCSESNEKTSAIRLFKFPNHLYLRNNYYGVLMDYAIAFTENRKTELESQLATLTSEFYAVNNSTTGIFSNAKYERFSYDIEGNNFYLDQTTASDYNVLERQNEWYFLINNYKTNIHAMKTIQDYTLVTANESAQLITSLQDNYVSGDRIVKLPLNGLDNLAVAPIKISCSWNRNYNGAAYHQVQELLVFHIRTYENNAIVSKIAYKNLIENTFDGDSNGLQVEVGLYNTSDTTYFDGTVPTNVKGICLKFKGAYVDVHSIKVRK